MSMTARAGSEVRARARRLPRTSFHDISFPQLSWHRCLEPTFPRAIVSLVILLGTVVLLPAGGGLVSVEPGIASGASLAALMLGLWVVSQPPETAPPLTRARREGGWCGVREAPQPGRPPRAVR